MARCEDCIHEKVCMHRANIQTDTYAYMGVKYDTEKCEHYTTADVVPKSEVEELQGEIEELQAKVTKLRKENIELLVSKETDIHISMGKLVKARTEHPIFKAIEEKVAMEIFEEINEDCFDQFGYFEYEAYAELKKKYTETKG